MGFLKRRRSPTCSSARRPPSAPAAGPVQVGLLDSGSNKMQVIKLGARRPASA